MQVDVGVGLALKVSQVSRPINGQSRGRLRNCSKPQYGSDYCGDIHAEYVADELAEKADMILSVQGAKSEKSSSSDLGPDGTSEWEPGDSYIS